MYITAFAHPDGIVEFHDDTYKRDGSSDQAGGSIGRPEPRGEGGGDAGLRNDAGDGDRSGTL